MSGPGKYKRTKEIREKISKSRSGIPNLKRRGINAKNRLCLIGKRFGRLIVIGFDCVKGKSQNTYWKCKCDCGNEKIICGHLLMSGETKSCGCLYKEKMSNGLGTKHGCARTGKVTPEYELWNRAKSRAARKGLEFTLLISDIVIPEFCPLLGIKLIRGYKKISANSPSLDRINPNKGYTKENIWVISNRANTAKQNLSFKELKMLADNLEQKIITSKINEERRDEE